MQQFSLINKIRSGGGMGIKETRKTTFKSKKVIWSPKEKELITKYRKGLIWKDIC